LTRSPPRRLRPDLLEPVHDLDDAIAGVLGRGGSLREDALAVGMESGQREIGRELAELDR
jgi:hypothetical protein